MDKASVAVIGMGPAGVSASIYLKRYGMNPICFEKEIIGGKVNKTERIENYAGIPSIGGMALAEEFEKQLDKFGIEVNYFDVKELSANSDGTYHLKTRKREYDFKYVILALGLGEKKFSIPGEEKFSRRGISSCAICDGNFYAGKDVAVIGAGTAAFEEATYLSTICSHVTLIARREEFRAQKYAVDNFLKRDNSEILAPYQAVEAYGDEKLHALRLVNNQTKEERFLNVEGLFLYIGEESWSDFVKIDDVKDEKKMIVTNADLETIHKGLFAVGDCRNTELRQVVTATRDGALAAMKIHEDFLRD